MFDRPLALALLLLAVPWIRWSRRRRPRPWLVGGLDPFRDSSLGRGARRGLPPSLLLGLLALLAGIAALAGLRWGDPDPLLVIDGSLSCSGFPSYRADRARLLDAFPGAEVTEVGSPQEPAAEAQILQRIRLYGAGRRVVVLSDRPEPLDVPSWVEWRNPYRAAGAANAAILNVWPEQGSWRIHWARWHLEAPLRLRITQVAPLADASPAPTWLPLEGEEGILALGVLSLPARLEIERVEGAAPDGRSHDDAWRIDPAPLFVLPDGADSRWPTALQAVFPGARVGSEADTSGAVLLDFDGRSEAASSFPGDPFARAAEYEAVAEIARRLEQLELASFTAPRPRSECQPPEQPCTWPEDLALAAAAPRRAANDRGLAALGLLLYLLSLVARRLGH